VADLRKTHLEVTVIPARSAKIELRGNIDRAQINGLYLSLEEAKDLHAQLAVAINTATR
jgi:hypothetical protein